jgi:FtsH-binding integral membrane protein
LNGKTLMSAILWAFTGALVGVAVSTPVLALIQSYGWMFLAGGFAVIAVAVGLTPSIRGKVGVPVVAAGCALAGYVLGWLVQGWKIGIALILAGAVGGTFLGLWLQERFTRNTRRTLDSGFYKG